MKPRHFSGGETIHKLRIVMGEFYAITLEQFRRILVNERILAFEKLLPARLKIEPKGEVNVRTAQSVDVSKLAEKFGMRGMKEGIRKGHLCFIADMDGEIAHYKWVALDEAYVSELKRSMHFDSNSAYIYSSYTTPDFRGYGLDPKVTAKVFDYLYEKGIKKVYILVRHNNFSSLRVIQKVGYRKMGEVRFIQVLSFRKYTCKGITEEDCNKIKEMFLLN